MGVNYFQSSEYRWLMKKIFDTASSVAAENTYLLFKLNIFLENAFFFEKSCKSNDDTSLQYLQVIDVL